MRQTKAQRLAAEIQALEDELRAHQGRCKHPERHRTYRLEANTGNYDPTQDCYWTAYTCGLCLRRWTEDGQRNLVGRRVQ